MKKIQMIHYDVTRHTHTDRHVSPKTKPTADQHHHEQPKIIDHRMVVDKNGTTTTTTTTKTTKKTTHDFSTNTHAPNKATCNRKE